MRVVVVGGAGAMGRWTVRDLTESERRMKAVRILHDTGYLADARAVARAMPAGPERDAYLGQVPGR